MLSRLLLFTLFWLLLTKAQWASWVIGVLVVPPAAWLSLRLFKPLSARQDQSTGPKARFNVLRLPVVVVFFLRESLVGGWQTASMALRRTVGAKPAFITYQISLPPGIAVRCFIHLISLLPGTISARCEGSLLTIHVLDINSYSGSDVIECEQQIADLFTLKLNTLPSEGRAL